MYVLRSKVKLSDASAERVLIGLAAPTAWPADYDMTSLPRFGVKTTAHGQLIKLDDHRSLLACTPANATAVWPQLAEQARPVGANAWQWLEIAAGQPRIVVATQEAFVPQMLNMELPAVAGVSFTKGCYPGQEIVARTQYLGKVKRRTYRARIADASLAASPGTPVFAPETGDQHCGAVVSVAASPHGGKELLVCVQSAAVAAGEVRVGAPDGVRLEFLGLPYEIS
jgi:folate-binding protein YgfZ